MVLSLKHCKQLLETYQTNAQLQISQKQLWTTADVASTFTPFVVFTTVLSAEAGCPINTYSTSKCLLGTCPLFTVCQPLLLLHQSQTNPAAETFKLPLSVRLPGRHLHSQRLQTLRERRGCLNKELPLRATCLQEEEDLKGN